MNIYFITGTILLLFSRFQKKQLLLRIYSITSALFFITYCIQIKDYYYIALNFILLALDFRTLAGLLFTYKKVKK